MKGNKPYEIVEYTLYKKNKKKNKLGARNKKKETELKL